MGRVLHRRSRAYATGILAVSVTSLLFLFSVLGAVSVPKTTNASYVATTTVSLTVCGDGVISGSEFCDDTTNTGAYANSIATRNCNPLCSAWGQYCGDAVIQTTPGEECDDGNNVAGDLCDVICQNETPPAVVGGGGGSGGGGGGKGSGNNAIPDASDDGEIDYNGDTDVIIRGRAYPGATVTILRDGEILRVVEANSLAEFDHRLTEQTPGITTFGFWALDEAGRQSITYSATFQIIENAVTTLAGVLVPPTLAVIPEKVDPGGTVTFEGSAIPNALLRAYIDAGEIPEETVASAGGDWTMVYDTSPLGVEEFHTVKASHIDPLSNDLKSGFSKIASFYVGTADVEGGLSADLNFDGSVNLTDFSILLFNWGTTSALADINDDGKVALADFSIMLFQWTG